MTVGRGAEAIAVVNSRNVSEQADERETCFQTFSIFAVSFTTRSFISLLLYFESRNIQNNHISSILQNPLGKREILFLPLVLTIFNNYLIIIKFHQNAIPLHNSIILSVSFKSKEKETRNSTQTRVRTCAHAPTQFLLCASIINLIG